MVAPQLLSINSNVEEKACIMVNLSSHHSTGNYPPRGSLGQVASSP